MGDYQRLVDYINNYFPDPTKYNQSDIRKWAKKSVPSWNGMPKSTQDGIIKDWDHFASPDDRKIPSLDRPRDSRGRFRRTSRIPSKVSKSGRPRDSRGRFTKFASNVNGKVKKFLGRSY